MPVAELQIPDASASVCLAYLDSGAPLSGSDVYTTIIAIHGLTWSAGTHPLVHSLLAYHTFC
jgi:hypothetical protein